MKYYFTISCGSRVELFSYNAADDDDKFIPTSLKSVEVEGQLESVVRSAKGLRLICLFENNICVHHHDFHTIVNTMRFPIDGDTDLVHVTCSPGNNYLVPLFKPRDVKDTKRSFPQPRRRGVEIIDLNTRLRIKRFVIFGSVNDLIRWDESTNDQYFSLSIPCKRTMFLYETSNFQMIGTPFKCSYNHFAWSPVGSRFILYTFSPHQSDGTGLVRLFEIASWDIVFQMQLIAVNILTFHWQSKGEYVAILYTGLAYSNCSQFNWIVYSVKANLTDSGSFEEKRHLIDFKWEPNSSRFAYSYTLRDKSCGTVEFYKMESVEGNNPRWSSFTSVKSSGFSESTLFWSPVGRYIVLRYNDKLGFVDVAVNSHKILAIINFKSSLVAWDPSGRFVHTSCNCEGVLKTIIWSARGERVYEFSAGKTMNWCGVIPVAENNEDDVEAPY